MDLMADPSDILYSIDSGPGSDFEVDDSGLSKYFRTWPNKVLRIHPNELGELVTPPEIDFGISPSDVEVSTASPNKIKNLAKFGINPVDLTKPSSWKDTEYLWWNSEDPHQLDPHYGSVAYSNLLVEKFRHFNTTTKPYMAVTDTTVVGPNSFAIDSTQGPRGRMENLLYLYERDLPLFCLHGWMIRNGLNDTPDRPLESRISIIFMHYQLTNELFSASCEALKRGSKLPLGINLADQLWSGLVRNVIWGYTNSIYKDEHSRRTGHFETTRESYIIHPDSHKHFYDVPSGVSAVGIRLAGITLPISK